MYNWLKGFLSNRYIRTRVNGVYSRTRPSKEGLPQGSALSCTLFLCFLNDLSEVIPTFNRLSFADNISTWQSDKNVDRATEALNSDLHALKRYCDQWCMQINTTKTVYNTYSKSREVLARDLELKIEDNRQPWLMSRPYYEGKRRKGGERRSKGMMTQGWLSFMRLDELMIITFTSREVTPYKCFACA